MTIVGILTWFYDAIIKVSLCQPKLRIFGDTAAKRSQRRCKHAFYILQENHLLLPTTIALNLYVKSANNVSCLLLLLCGNAVPWSPSAW